MPFSDLFKGVFQKIYIASETPKHLNVISSSPSTLPPASAQRLCCSMEGKSNDNKHPQLINIGIFPFLHDMITAWDGVPVGFVVKQNVKCLNHTTTQMMLKINLFRSAFFIGHFLHTHSLDGLLYPTHTHTQSSGWQHGGYSIISSGVNNKQITRTKNRHTGSQALRRIHWNSARLMAQMPHLYIEAAKDMTSLPVWLM